GDSSEKYTLIRGHSDSFDPSCPSMPTFVTENVSVSGSYGDGGDDEEQALLDRMAKREERRQRRMKEALERQKQLDPDASEASEGVALEKNNVEEERPSSWRKGRYRDSMDEDEKTKHNGGPCEEAALKQHRKPERTLSRGSVRSPEAVASDEQDENARLEAERKLEELKRRRDDAESEEFERMRQKQQEAEAELEELKRKREERRKILEEEERQRKQEEEERKAREEEEKRKMKEEIERRRAEAAEKRQKVDDTMDGEGKPFKCVIGRNGIILHILRFHLLILSNSAVKAAHSPVVSKIDNRLEQYTSAAQNRESRSPRSGAVDLPVVTDSIRNIKSMWEKGSVFNAPGNGGSAFKEAAVIKTGVAGRINDWLNKTPDGGRTPGGKPTDLKPVDVTNKRSLWENKGGASTKSVFLRITNMLGSRGVGKNCFADEHFI
uniref:Caldesmon 1 n=1 Tax=Oryzias sinensis TaxID=183150 RepID=A0A8C7ZWJ5_9TELE